MSGLTPANNLILRKINIRSESGVEQIKLSGEEIRELEPNLSSQIQGGWYFPKAHHTLDPDLILEKVYQGFLSRGGQFQKEEVSAIHPERGFNSNQ
jgi:glycine/D-amino acid oxidase-like deaminating enzyme